MRSVAFIATESGDDLILSFALRDWQDPSEIQSLILQRTPKYEPLLEEHERGVQVSLEGAADDEDDYLESLDYSQPEEVVRIKTALRHYDLDVRRVDRKELARMGPLLRKMNYDGRFKISGV